MAVNVQDLSPIIYNMVGRTGKVRIMSDLSMVIVNQSGAEQLYDNQTKTAQLFFSNAFCDYHIVTDLLDWLKEFIVKLENFYGDDMIELVLEVGMSGCILDVNSKPIRTFTHLRTIENMV